MKKTLCIIAIIACFIPCLKVNGQEIKESCNIIETSIKDHQYYDFTLSGDGFLSYAWGNNDDNHTNISVDLTKVTISKDYTFGSWKIWINCIEGNDCISESGIIGARDGMYFNYSKTFLPANSEGDMNAIFIQLNYLIKVASGSK
jgi:hypothetical protein